MNLDDALGRLDALERDVDFILDDAKAHGELDAAWRFCPRCLYEWRIHDTHNLEWVKRSPQGCPPSETEAVQGWGR